MKTQDIRNMALAFQAVTEKKSVTEATVSSGQVLHDLEHKDEPAHAVEMKQHSMGKASLNIMAQSHRSRKL